MKMSASPLSLWERVACSAYLAEVVRESSATAK
jgi:hypothetical protein